MKEISRERLEQILEEATVGGNQCGPMPFEAGRTRRRLAQNEGLQLDPPSEQIPESLSKEEEERLQAEYRSFHVHTGILSDLGYIEVWDPNPPSGNARFPWFIEEDEFWPKRVTGKGYKALGYLKDESFKKRIQASGKWTLIRLVDAAVHFGNHLTIRSMDKTATTAR